MPYRVSLAYVQGALSCETSNFGGLKKLYGRKSFKKKMKRLILKNEIKSLSPLIF
jgi:hypothetical protein